MDLIDKYNEMCRKEREKRAGAGEAPESGVRLFGSCHDCGLRDCPNVDAEPKWSRCPALDR